MSNIDIDLHIGRKLRRRRRVLGMTQEEVGRRVGVRFQQIQKYECAANRVTASRLFCLAQALDVPVNYFFDGLSANDRLGPPIFEAIDVGGDPIRKTNA